MQKKKIIKFPELKHFSEKSPQKNSDKLNLNHLPTNCKELTEDSFVLEHYSEMKESHILKEKEQKIEFLSQTLDKKNDSKISSLPDASRLFRIKTFLKKRPSIFSFFLEINKNDSSKFSYFDYIIYILKTICCMKKSSKEQLITEAEKTYREDMDVTNMVKKLHDVEKLKILLFDEDQLLLFNYLSKPIIKLSNNNYGEDENMKSSIRMSKMMNSKFEKDSKDIETSYKKILRLKNDDKINQRLIDLFDLKFALGLKNENFDQNP